MPNIEAIAGLSVPCRGVAKDRLIPLEIPAQASITLYNNGDRNVGCDMLKADNGTCRAAEFLGIQESTSKCIQLYPSNSEVVTYPDRPEQTELGEEALKKIRYGIEEGIQLNTYREAVRYFLSKIHKEAQEHAKELGMTGANLSNILNGHRRPPKKTTVMKQIEALQLNSEAASKLLELAQADHYSEDFKR